jgi:hypothetical protein
MFEASYGLCHKVKFIPTVKNIPQLKSLLTAFRLISALKTCIVSTWVVDELLIPKSANNERNYARTAFFGKQVYQNGQTFFPWFFPLPLVEFKYL